jgi:hypothetical protein
MAYLLSKGTILEQYISAAFVAVAQVESVSFSGAQSETMELRPLDASNAGVIHIPNGWVEGGSVTFNLIYDAALAGHQSITDVVNAPATTNWRLKHTDGSATATTFTSGGIGFGEEINATTAVRGSVTLKVTGLVTWPT